MKLHRKLAKLARRETYRRGWRRAQRSVFRLPLGPVLAGLDQNRLAEIQKCYAGEKYADVDQWLRVNRERVQDLKLHRSPPQRVLDLGCGGGFFLFVLKRFGHSVLGLDLDESSLFKELLEVFRVPRTVFRIQPFESLPNLHQQFDWITAFSIGFDRYRATNSRLAAKSISRSIHYRMAIILHRSCGTSFPSAAPTSSANGSSSLRACTNNWQDRHLVTPNSGKLFFLPRLP